MMPAQFGLFLLGCFYAFAGVVAVRAALQSRFLDVATAAIEGGKPPKVETWRTLWLLVSALNVGAGGLALAVLSQWALPLFLIALCGQVFYLTVLAPRIFDAAEAPVAAGRRQTITAAIVYACATALVIWAQSEGVLRASDAVSPQAGIAALAAFVAFAGYSVYRFMVMRAA